MKPKAIIVETDDALRTQVQKIFSFYGILDFVAFFDNPDRAYDFILSSEVDVAFIDLAAGDGSHCSDGTFLAYSLATVRPDVITIAYCAEDQPASAVSKLRCADFFVSPPQDPVVIQRVVDRIKYRAELLEYKRQSRNRSIMIKTSQGYQLINLDTVLFIERFNRKNRIITTDGKQITLNGYTLDELAQLLSPAGFYRCYQSFIVNLSKITSIRVDSISKNYALQFEGFVGEVLLSRDKYSEILKLLKERYANISL